MRSARFFEIDINRLVKSFPITYEYLQEMSNDVSKYTYFENEDIINEWAKKRDDAVEAQKMTNNNDSHRQKTTRLQNTKYKKNTKKVVDEESIKRLKVYHSNE